jgi:hypothetical protein
MISVLPARIWNDDEVEEELLGGRGGLQPGLVQQGHCDAC